MMSPLYFYWERTRQETDVSVTTTNPLVESFGLEEPLVKGIDLQWIGVVIVLGIVLFFVVWWIRIRLRSLRRRERHSLERMMGAQMGWSPTSRVIRKNKSVGRVSRGRGNRV